MLLPVTFHVLTIFQNFNAYPTYHVLGLSVHHARSFIHLFVCLFVRTDFVTVISREQL